MVSANSNKADLGNKRKVEFTLDNGSNKANNHINAEKKPAMTINEQSITSSRLPENLVVSIALPDRNKKLTTQAMPAAADKRKDQTESFNT